MCNLELLKKKIEDAREEVRKSLEKDPYEVSYEKNKKLDKLIENYLDIVEELPTNPHQHTENVS